VVFSIGRATAVRTPNKPYKEASKTERTHAANLQSAAPFTLRLQASAKYPDPGLRSRRNNSLLAS